MLTPEFRSEKRHGKGVAEAMRCEILDSQFAANCTHERTDRGSIMPGFPMTAEEKIARAFPSLFLQCLIGARDLIIDGVHIAELAYQPSYS